jgi:iron complex transport system substrate-binding protein
MMARRGGLAALALLWAGLTAAGEPGTPRRVASLNLTADEILVEILPPERLVAVTAFADEDGTSNILGRVPPGVVRFPKTDMERLVAVRPDLVVVSEYTDADFLKLLERSGLRYHRMEGLGSLSGIRAAILALGQAVG